MDGAVQILTPTDGTPPSRAPPQILPDERTLLLPRPRRGRARIAPSPASTPRVSGRHRLHLPPPLASTARSSCARPRPRPRSLWSACRLRGFACCTWDWILPAPLGVSVSVPFVDMVRCSCFGQGLGDALGSASWVGRIRRRPVLALLLLGVLTGLETECSLFSSCSLFVLSTDYKFVPPCCVVSS